MSYRRVQKDSDELLYTVRSLVMVCNQRARQRLSSYQRQCKRISNYVQFFSMCVTVVSDLDHLSDKSVLYLQSLQWGIFEYISFSMYLQTKFHVRFSCRWISWLSKLYQCVVIETTCYCTVELYALVFECTNACNVQECKTYLEFLFVTFNAWD